MGSSDGQRDQSSPTSGQSEPWTWLAATKELQEKVYKYVFDKDDALNFPELVSKYLDWNTTAAVQELAEMRIEFSWKPWAKDDPFVNPIRVRNELIDALHFIGNMLVACGVTDEELWTAYRQKQEINRARAASGNYSAKKGGLGDGSD